MSKNTLHRSALKTKNANNQMNNCKNFTTYLSENKTSLSRLLSSPAYYICLKVQQNKPKASTSQAHQN